MTRETWRRKAREAVRAAGHDRAIDVPHAMVCTAGVEGMRTAASAPVLARIAGCSDDTVRRALRALEAAGLVAADRRLGRATVYRLTVPSDLVDEDAEHAPNPTQLAEGDPTQDAEGTLRNLRTPPPQLAEGPHLIQRARTPLPGEYSPPGVAPAQPTPPPPAPLPEHDLVVAYRQAADEVWLGAVSPALATDADADALVTAVQERAIAGDLPGALSERAAARDYVRAVLRWLPEFWRRPREAGGRGRPAGDLMRWGTLAQLARRRGEGFLEQALAYEADRAQAGTAERPRSVHVVEAPRPLAVEVVPDEEIAAVLLRGAVALGLEPRTAAVARAEAAPTSADSAGGSRRAPVAAGGPARGMRRDRVAAEAALEGLRRGALALGLEVSP